MRIFWGLKVHSPDNDSAMQAFEEFTKYLGVQCTFQRCAAYDKFENMHEIDCYSDHDIQTASAVDALIEKLGGPSWKDVSTETSEGAEVRFYDVVLDSRTVNIPIERIFWIHMTCELPPTS